MSAPLITRARRAPCLHSEKARKPRAQASDEYGGSGVTLGWEKPEHDWDEAIARAISATSRRTKLCLVREERIPIRREVFPTSREQNRRVRATCSSISPPISSAANLRLPHPPQRPGLAK